MREKKNRTKNRPPWSHEKIESNQKVIAFERDFFLIRRANARFCRMDGKRKADAALLDILFLLFFIFVLFDLAFHRFPLFLGVIKKL
jgi:hypothetical protein